MLWDRQDAGVGELGVELRGAFELGGPGLAGVAIEQPAAQPGKAAADRELADLEAAVMEAIGDSGGRSRRGCVSTIRVGESDPGQSANLFADVSSTATGHHRTLPRPVFL